MTVKYSHLQAAGLIYSMIKPALCPALPGPPTCILTTAVLQATQVIMSTECCYSLHRTTLCSKQNLSAWHTVKMLS